MRAEERPELLVDGRGQRPKIDYLDDPKAPKANSLVALVNVGVMNERGDVLLIRRTDNENWALPGGAMDIGETIAEAGVRETREETGIGCRSCASSVSTRIDGTSCITRATTRCRRSAPSSSPLGLPGGVECEIDRLVGVYTNPRHVMLYTSNGEVRQECSLVFAAHVTAGLPRPSSESSEVRWVSPTELDRYQMHPSMRQRVEHLLERRIEPYIG